ncbi:MAG: hypothetical protein ACQESH_06650 [Campylobacterota bacterium]
MVRLLLSAFVAVFLLSGCAAKLFEHRYSSHITIKTPQLRYSDMGFVSQNPNEIHAQIYSLANPVFTIKMYSNVCINRACYRYSAFNEQYLHPSYENKLIKKVFLGKPIFDAKDVVQIDGGFEQKLRSSEYDIIYSVNETMIRFSDRKNNILIKIRKTGE